MVQAPTNHDARVRSVSDSQIARLRRLFPFLRAEHRGGNARLFDDPGGVFVDSSRSVDSTGLDDGTTAAWSASIRPPQEQTSLMTQGCSLFGALGLDLDPLRQSPRSGECVAGLIRTSEATGNVSRHLTSKGIAGSRVGAEPLSPQDEDSKWTP